MGLILDTRYWMLDNQQLTRSGFQKHRASSIQNLRMFSISYIATTDSDYNNLCNCRAYFEPAKLPADKNRHSKIEN